MNFIRDKWSAYGVSLLVHLAILVPLLFVGMGVHRIKVESALETFFESERTTDDFTRELNTNLEISETTNAIAGAAIAGSGVVGGGNGLGGSGGVGTVSSKIEGSQQFKDNDVALSLGNVDLPGSGDIGTDLGEGVVKGEPQAATAGYGEAMDRVAQELLRIMREDRVLVCWLFDESESMKDDQEQIKAHFRKIYVELGIQQNQDAKLKGKPGDEQLLTAVHSFGAKITKHTAKPTDDDKTIMQAIDKIGVDETGKELTCTAIQEVLDEYRQFKVRSKRKVVIIVVTDESGDDGEKVDETITKAQAIKAPIYILGREAVFGYPYAIVEWKDPKYGLVHWLRINRGPETAYFEALQFDGMRERRDAHPSGFAPYEQARLCRDTGGIFFLLPFDEETLHDKAAIDKRKFEFLSMKEYVPELIPRKQYVEARNQSKFRETIVEVAQTLDPNNLPANEKLRVQDGWFNAEKSGFMREGQEAFSRAMNNFVLLDQAAQRLEAVRKLRDQEQSQRWRANYDLALGQVKAYRVRMFQFMLIMDDYLNKLPDPTNPKHNVWNLARTKAVLKPTDRQVKLTKVDLQKLTKEDAEARELLQSVIRNHPNTPWSNRAELELNEGFGWKWQSGFRDPRYNNIGQEIKFPTL